MTDDSCTVRPCSTGKSHSQINLYHYALPQHTLTDGLVEFIIAHLRYFLGGDRPSQTTFYPRSLF